MDREIPGVDLHQGDQVAIKFYRLQLMHGAQTLRVQREFAVASEVQHPNLARVHDLLISPNRPFYTFMVMEYVDGVTLKEYISSTDPMSVQAVIRIGIQLFDALAELHSLDAIHRDVKPANVMVRTGDPVRPTIKLVDLGVVSVISEPTFTETSAFLGSKHSAPMEQLAGDPLDERADIYGAGAVLFSCYKGRPMYNRVGPEGAIVRQMLKEPERLSTRGPSVGPADEELVKFVNKCIAIDKCERPRTADECLDKLRRIEAMAGL